MGEPDEPALRPDPATTSRSGSTYGIRSVRNSPSTSPSGVRISSPTSMRTPRSRSRAATAAATSWWSVTNTTSMPCASARAASSSTPSTESPDATVWTWQSTRTLMRPPPAVPAAPPAT
ncbi:hypothetical protein BJF90_20580 [Pseudonocardia sp. CNS-004]|nr:hypothetical protein BJF90_20580 [Pseudonocardia sp. CNS-004]